jgi:dihydrolipoamide dehydrogenase
MIARKQAIVDQTSGGVKYLMDKNKVTVLKVCSFVDATHVAVAKADGTSETVEAKNIIIATGSKPSSLPLSKLIKKE